MGISQVADRFFTYESRLASFQKAQPISKRRVSITTIKGQKSMKWPHNYLSAHDLAKAGFFYYPTQVHPDNVVCFLCHKALDGWEESDDPLVEHLKHSPNCGWAITATTEKRNDHAQEENPLSSKMIEARKATFAEKWPHENKRGWKCRTTQMVEGGWKYKPTSLNDDMVACSYCALTIHGWEKLDKPTDKHYEKSPQCAFFSLSNRQNNNNLTKKARAPRTRASKTSRLSAQSDHSASTEASIFTDLPATDERSIPATTSLGSQKITENKKATLGKNRKTRANKNEILDYTESEKSDNKKLHVHDSIRNKKRKSEESELNENASEIAPVPKKRSTRSRGNTAVDYSVKCLTNISSLLVAKAKPKKSRSTHKISTASTVQSRSTAPDGDTNAATEASSDGDGSDISQVKSYTNPDHHMSALEINDTDEAAIVAELGTIKANVILPSRLTGEHNPLSKKALTIQRSNSKSANVIESEQDQKKDNLRQHVLASGHGTSQNSGSLYSRKPGGQTPISQATIMFPRRLTRGSLASLKNEPSATEDQYTDESGAESGNETDGSIASRSTVISGNRYLSSSTNKWRNEGPRRNIEEIVNVSEGPGSSFLSEDQTRLAREMKSLNFNDMGSKESSPLVPVKAVVTELAVDSQLQELGQSFSDDALSLTKTNTSPLQSETIVQAEFEKASVSQTEFSPQKSLNSRERTPRLTRSLTRLTTSLSLSRQTSCSSSNHSSNAENQPPSLELSTIVNKIATPKTTRRVVISFSTPVVSPSKRNIVSSLISNQPWTAVDLETIFLNSPSSPTSAMANVDLLGSALCRVKDGVLSSPEKEMTVEEWIHYNAQIAEERLKNECERIVGNFEREGTRAMQALEGVECCN